jgi:hypothetical protein
MKIRGTILRWYLGGLLVLMIVIGYAVYHYVMTKPAEPGTFIGRMYEQAVKKKLSSHCRDAIARVAGSDEANTEAQIEGACTCFTDQMFERFRDVPPGQLDTVAEEEETARAAESIFNKCVNQAGLN